jgi:folylpolyglutamate synthase/dihydropteroate synthase
VCGCLPPEAFEVVQAICRQRNAPLFTHGREYSSSCRSSQDAKQEFEVEWFGQSSIFTQSLLGEHQTHNMSVAVAICRVLGFSASECHNGLLQLNWPGRLELVGGRFGRPIYLDCAHNLPGIEALISFLDRTNKQPEIYFGVLRDKNWQKMIDLLVPHIGKWNIVEPPASRALSTSELAGFLLSRGVDAVDFTNDYSKLISTIVSGGKAPALITGSIYHVGAVREMLGLPFGRLWRGGTGRQTHVQGA